MAAVVDDREPNASGAAAASAANSRLESGMPFPMCLLGDHVIPRLFALPSIR
jgi:hypothetical protein